MRYGLYDNQQQLDFLRAQATYIEAVVYRIQYPEIMYPSLVHLRRHKYQDVLVTPAATDVGSPSSLTISFQADDDITSLATRAREAPALGASSVVGPIDTPWNTTDVRVTDPAGHRLVFTSRRASPDPEQVAKWSAMMERARQHS